MWIYTLCITNTTLNKRASLRGIRRQTRPVSWRWCCWVVLFDTEEKVAVCNLMMAGRSSWFVITAINGHRGALNCLFPRDFCVACWHLFPRSLLSLQHCFQFHNLHHQPNFKWYKLKQTRTLIYIQIWSMFLLVLWQILIESLFNVLQWTNNRRLVLAPRSTGRKMTIF